DRLGPNRLGGDQIGIRPPRNNSIRHVRAARLPRVGVTRRRRASSRLALPGGRLRVREGKTAGPEPGGQADPFRGHLLARLVLRPAVEFGRTKTLRRALAVLDRMAGGAPPVGGVDRGREAAVGVTV